MDAQLVLLDTPTNDTPQNDSPQTDWPPLDSPQTDWRLDHRTRETGRRGIADARARLASVAANHAAA